MKIKEDAKLHEILDELIKDCEKKEIMVGGSKIVQLGNSIYEIKFKIIKE